MPVHGIALTIKDLYSLWGIRLYTVNIKHSLHKYRVCIEADECQETLSVQRIRCRDLSIGQFGKIVSPQCLQARSLSPS